MVYPLPLSFQGYGFWCLVYDSIKGRGIVSEVFVHDSIGIRYASRCIVEVGGAVLDGVVGGGTGVGGVHLPCGVPVEEWDHVTIRQLMGGNGFCLVGSPLMDT